MDEARDSGRTILSGGNTIGETAYAPTVVLNPNADVRLSTAEIFGPVVAIYGYETLDEAITRANSLPFAFQAADFTQQLDTATKLIRSLNATAVMINEHSVPTFSPERSPPW